MTLRHSLKHSALAAYLQQLDGKSPARSAALQRVALYGGDCVQESDCELALFQICT